MSEQRKGAIINFVGTKEEIGGKYLFSLQIFLRGAAASAELAAELEYTKFAAGLPQNLYFSSGLAAGRLSYVGTGTSIRLRLQQRFKLGINIVILVPT